MKDTDIEMLELAAKAVGGVLSKGHTKRRTGPTWDTWEWIGSPGIVFGGLVMHPQIDDGDSRRLQVALRLTLCMHTDGAAMCVSGDGRRGTEVRDQADAAANARKAVLLVAAEIGKGMA